MPQTESITLTVNANKHLIITVNGYSEVNFRKITGTEKWEAVVTDG